MNINYKITTLVLGILSIILIIFLVAETSSNKKRDFSNMHKLHESSERMDHSMHTMMMDMTARMNGKTGEELDRVFLEDMIVHHQGAVDMALELQKGTKRPELQKMARDIIDAQTKEIQQMKDWHQQWFPKTQ